MNHRMSHISKLGIRASNKNLRHRLPGCNKNENATKIRPGSIKQGRWMICKEDYLSFAIGDRDGIFGSRNYAVAKLDAVKGNTKDRHDDA